MSLTSKWLRRLLALALTVVCLAGAVLPVAAVKSLPTAQQAEPEDIVTARVYYGAGTGSRVIGLMENGTRLTVLNTYGSFYRVDCYGMTGYVLQALVEQRNGEYYVNCQEGQKGTELMAAQTLSKTVELRSALVEEARTHLGTYYVYGGSRPGGFDCSGLTSYLYKTVDMSIYRTASDQLRDGLVVPKDELQVGDLVFFRIAGYPYLASHVGIYVGDGQMIHSDNSGVRYTSMDDSYYARYYIGARRIIGTDKSMPEGIPAAATEMNPRARTAGGLRW